MPWGGPRVRTPTLDALGLRTGPGSGALNKQWFLAAEKRLPPTPHSEGRRVKDLHSVPGGEGTIS